MSTLNVPFSFATRDCTDAAFWNERFEQHYIPWDQGGVPLALQEYVARTAPTVALIPGCGSGYEVAYLSEAGWDVTAIDFSSVAVNTAQVVLERWGVRVLQADFFTFVPVTPVKLIYERAFFCALPVAKRTAIVRRWAELLAPGGTLAGFFFFGDTRKGPPFGIDQFELERLLLPYFELMDDRSVLDSIAVFAEHERWQEWRRRA